MRISPRRFHATAEVKVCLPKRGSLDMQSTKPGLSGAACSVRAEPAGRTPDWVGGQSGPAPPSPTPMQLPWLVFLVSPDSAQVRPAPAPGQTDRLRRLLRSRAQDAERETLRKGSGRRGALSRAGVCSPGEKAEQLPGEQARSPAMGSQAVHGPPLSFCPSVHRAWFSDPRALGSPGLARLRVMVHVRLLSDSQDWNKQSRTDTSFPT